MGKIVTRAKATVCGQPKDDELAISFELSPESEELKSTHGRLFGVLEIKNPNPDPNPLIGKKALELLEESYFHGGNASHLANLKESLGFLTQYLRNQIGDTGQLNGAFVVIWEDISYLATLGHGRILIWRRDTLAPVLSGGQAIFIQVASGKIINDDLLIFETGSFTKVVDDQKLSASFDHRPVSEIAEGLLPAVLKEDKNPGAAGLFLQLTVEEKIEDEEIVDEPIVSQVKKIPVRAIFRQIASRLPRFHRDLYLRHQTNTKPLFVIFAFIILVVAVLWQIRLQKIKEAGSESNRLFSQAQSQLVSGQDLPRAKLALENFALKKYGPNWQKKKDSEIQKIQSLISQIAAAYLVVAKIYYADPALFYDLTLIKNQAQSTFAVGSSQNIIFLDGRSGAVFSLDTKTKSGTIVSGDEVFQGAKFLSVRGEYIYIFTPAGIYRLDTSRNKKDLLIKKDEKYQDIISQIGFTGNLYLLDKKANQIWKYIAVETGFSDLKTYLNPDVKPDFSQSLDLTIDGSVYVLNSSGQILKFTQGLPENFILTGLDNPLSSPSQILATDNFFYLFSATSRRLVLFDKEGKYHSQYLISGDFPISQAVILEPLKKLFLISFSKIYTVALN